MKDVFPKSFGKNVGDAIKKTKENLEKVTFYVVLNLLVSLGEKIVDTVE